MTFSDETWDLQTHLMGLEGETRALQGCEVSQEIVDPRIAKMFVGDIALDNILMKIWEDQRTLSGSSVCGKLFDAVST